MISDISNKEIRVNHIPGPLGVRGRNSDNTLILEKLEWAPSQPLRVGLVHTYEWIATQIKTQSNQKSV